MLQKPRRLWVLLFTLLLLALTSTARAYTVTVTTAGSGTVTNYYTSDNVIGTNVVTDGQSFPITITAAPNYEYAELWVDDGDGTGFNLWTSPDHPSPWQFNYNGHPEIALYIVFTTTINYTMTASASGDGIISPSGSVSVGQGGNKVFTATPNEYRYVQSVLVDGIAVTTTPPAPADSGVAVSYTLVNVQAPHTVQAVFDQKQWTITATAPVGGTISPSGAVGIGEGNSQIFTMTTDPVCTYDELMIDGSPWGIALAQFQFNRVVADRSIAPVFSCPTRTVTASAGPNGTISPTGASTVPYKGAVTYTLTPTVGYRVADVLVDGVSVGAVTSYTVSNVTADCTISASFTEDYHYVLRDNATLTEFVQVSPITNTPTGVVKTYPHDSTLKAVDFMRQGGKGYLLLDSPTLAKLVELDANFVPTGKEKTYSHYDYWSAVAVWINADSSGYTLWDNTTVLTNGLGEAILHAIDSNFSITSQNWSWPHYPSWKLVDYSRNNTNAFMVFYSTSCLTQLWTMSAGNAYQSNVQWGPSDPLWKPRDFAPNADGSGNLAWDYEGAGSPQGCLWWLNTSKVYTGQYLYYPHSASARIEAYAR